LNSELKKLRKSKGLTMEQLGDLSGSSKGCICDLETGMTNPSLQKAYDISAALGACITKVFPNKARYETITTKTVRVKRKSTRTKK